MTTAEEYRKTALALMTNAKDAQSRLDSVIDVLIHELEAARADRDRLAGQIEDWRRYFDIDTSHWRDTLEYAAVALEASSDNGDRYCASQIRAALASAEGPGRTLNVSIPHDAEIIRGWAEEVQARGMRSDHIYELADAVLTLLDQRDRLDEIRQQDRRFIKGLQSDRDQLLENYRVLTRRYDLLEAELARERARLARKVEAVRALHGHSIDPNECMECDMSADAHQLAPRGFPCRTLAALASTDGSEQ